MVEEESGGRGVIKCFDGSCWAQSALAGVHECIDTADAGGRGGGDRRRRRRAYWAPSGPGRPRSSRRCRGRGSSPPHLLSSCGARTPASTARPGSRPAGPSHRLRSLWRCLVSVCSLCLFIFLPCSYIAYTREPEIPLLTMYVPAITRTCKSIIIIFSSSTRDFFHA